MNKKVIIIEGMDRVGKDSLISNLSKKFNSPVVLHSGIPKTDKDLFSFYYDGVIHDTLDYFYDNKTDAIFHNRSMYGEYVYGPKYRNESPEEVLKVIDNLEIGQLKTFILEHELYLILLNCTDLDLLKNNDDGNSLSSSFDDLKYESDAFNYVFDHSKIKNKLRVDVNINRSYRDKSDIANEVFNFITSHS
jgi:hypothetical protein